jgi:hypothetical protein
MPVLFVHQGTVVEGDEFFSARWAQASAISDPGLELYKAFGLLKAGMKELFAPKVLACGLRAAGKGHLVGKPIGDLKQMPGFFVVEGNRIVKEHRSEEISDHPDFAAFAS